MKRMKRLSYFFVFALLMTTLLSGTSVFAGEDVPSPGNISVNMSGTTQIEVSLTMDNNFMNITGFDFTSERKDGTATPKTVNRNRDSVPTDGNKKTYKFNLEDLFDVDGTYVIKVAACGYSEKSAAVDSASFKVTLPKKESSSGGSGGSGGGGGGGSTSTITDIVAPSVRSVTVDQSYTLMGKANIRVEANYGTYKENGSSVTCWDNKFELLDGSKVIGSGTGSYYYNFSNITVPYGKYKTFTVRVSATIDGKVHSGTKTVKARSKQMKKVKGVRATKISAKRAVVRWSSVEGATSYRIYKGKKKVKEVKSSVLKTSIKGKGAGKAKYKVVPVRKSEGKKYAGRGATAKPKANIYVTSNTGKVNTWTVKATFAVKKVSLSGKTYTVTGWGKNYAMYIKLKKFKSIKITIYCDGKIVAKKTIKNKKMNLKPQSSKKLTFKIKGKAGADLRNGFTSVYVRSTCDPATLTSR